MTSIASASISSRSSPAGQRAPMTCSFRFSPVPSPRKKRPGIIAATVAAAWAITTGCVRIIGQVTPVPTRIRSVASAIPPSVAQTNGLSPCEPTQGWKWSEMSACENPASSARRACFTRSEGGCSSLESA
jgi:hypothetical protein